MECLQLTDRIVIISQQHTSLQLIKFSSHLNNLVICHLVAHLAPALKAIDFDGPLLSEAEVSFILDSPKDLEYLDIAFSLVNDSFVIEDIAILKRLSYLNLTYTDLSVECAAELKKHITVIEI